MAFYDQHPPHMRQQSWDPAQAPGRAGAGSASQYDETPAFRSQFEEIERAQENLAKGGRSHPPTHGRRDSMPSVGSFAGQFPPDRMGPPRHHSISEYEQMRGSPSVAGLQGYLSNQRFPAPRQSEPESMLQIKRRAAAQRERELRNYHQEQQYNRSQPGSKADRSMSPNAMNEENRRELIARQHRALYGDGSNIYDGSQQRPLSQDARVLAAATASGHGSSPLGFDSFGQPSSSSAEGTAPLKAPSGQGSRSRSNSASAKAANPGGFAMFDNGQSNRASSTSPGQSGQTNAPTSGAPGMGPIGTRPTQSGQQGKRNTPPSGSGNTPVSGSEKPSSLGWGASNGPWGGTGKGMGQTSVWG